MTFRSVAALILFGLLASCAEGGGAALTSIVGDGGGVGSTTCGNGVIDGADEVCECPVGSTGPCVVQEHDCSYTDQTKTGTLLCDQTMCMFLEDMCMSGGAAGSGGSGTGG